MMLQKANKKGPNDNRSGAIMNPVYATTTTVSAATTGGMHDEDKDGKDTFNMMKAPTRVESDRATEMGAYLTVSPGPTLYVQQGLNPAIEYYSEIYDELENVSASRDCTG